MLHYFLSNPRGWNRAYFCSTGSSFWDIGRCFFFSIKLGHWQKFQSCTYTLFVPKGFKIELIFALWATVSEILAVFQNFHIWALARVPEVVHIHVLSFYPTGSKLSLFFLYLQPFLRYGTIIKISIFGHEIFSLKTVSKVAYVLSFYPQGPKLSLFLLYG